MATMDDQPPDGYHYKWVEDEHWKLGTSYLKCRMLKCPKTPIAEFFRFSFLRNRAYAYAYCEDHLYGRRILNGKIKSRKLVPNASC